MQPIAIYLEDKSPHPANPEVFETILRKAQLRGIGIVHYSGSPHNLEILGREAEKKGIQIYYILDLLNSNNYFFSLLSEVEIYKTEDVFGNYDWYFRNHSTRRPGTPK